MEDFYSCPVCNSDLKVIDNKFCEIRSELVFNELEFRQYLCEKCKHSCTYHNVPLDIIYKAETALATDRELGDFRKEFIKRNLNLSTIDGLAIEIGGGPGELAEDLRSECGHEKGIVVDFVDRVSFESLNFVHSDLNDCKDHFASSLAEYNIKHKRNIFVLSHVLEHIFKPSELLSVLKEFKNSYFFIEVPDFGVPHSKLDLRYSINCPDHIHYFNSQSFLSLIQNTGFNIIAFERQSSPLVPALRVLCNASDLINSIGDYEEHLQLVSDEIAEIINKHSATHSIYLWGLSAFAAEAIRKTPGKVKGIFDTKYEFDIFQNIHVFKDPVNYNFMHGENPVFICGSTFSVVQEAMRNKLAILSPDYTLLTVPYE
ncbi:class I SAM-dependent methyltransferase [Enterobacteriaceae bacterium H4N4]|uniref:Class I SAM-dependent methyltransferase n=1 Tax=Silvania confinis TaxID=2926470 RepID=A0A9J6QN02_9ENTR|nr:class I SAM-dependent methyltransferase [Silvania confinis]MCU6669629.1 class I SAM-dependent methyltransferase [Silvania confinis]